MLHGQHVCKPKNKDSPRFIVDTVIKTYVVELHVPNKNCNNQKLVTKTYSIRNYNDS